MKVVLLYGPPAAGKLTVAVELERLTGFRLFHNHLTVNLSIDNSIVSAPDVARRIVQRYGL